MLEDFFDSFPPGLLYLLRILSRSTLLSFLAYITEIVILRCFDASASHGLVILGAVAAHPILSLTLKDVTHRADARRRGATIVPHVHDAWPGSLGTVAALVKSFKFGYPADVFHGWCNRYGNTFSLNVFSETRIFTIEPEYVKHILATQFDNFDKGPIMADQLYSLLGTGVFNSDGDMWKFHRTMTRPFFTRDRISHFEIFDRHADVALKLAKRRLAEGHVINFQDLVSRFTLDSATEFLFGLNVRSLSADLPYPSSKEDNSLVEHPSDRFVHAFVRGLNVTGLRLRYGPAWPLTEFWRDQVKDLRKVMDEFAEPILQDALRRKADRKDMLSRDETEGKKEQVTLLDHLLEKTEDPQIMKDEFINLLVAGRDGVAATLTFGVYMLTQHPHITEHLQEEILSVVGPTERPTYDQIKEMKYLRAFINETLRLYPPVPLNSRTSKSATVWPSKTPGKLPLYIPPNTECAYSIFLMHRREDLWGPDVLQFDPDRFIDERLQKYLLPNPYIFLPFNAGPRICLGQQFAYNETSFFLIRLLQKFSGFVLEQPTKFQPPKEWKVCQGTKGLDKVQPALHLTMNVKGGLWIKMMPLSDEKSFN